MYQGGNYQDFLKWGGGLVFGHSIIIIKSTWKVFFWKFAIWPVLQLGTKEQPFEICVFIYTHSYTHAN